MEEGTNVDTVYLDFSKAFDRVDIGILMHEMRDMGVHGRLALWIHSFLADRKQVVIANGAKSTTDFKFISKVESQTNIFFYKISVLAHLNDFLSKTNRFTNLYAKLLREKTWSPIHGLSRFLD